MLNRRIKKRLLIAALALAIIAAIAVVVILISSKSANTEAPTSDFIEVYRPIESYYTRSPFDMAYPTPENLTEKLTPIIETANPTSLEPAGSRAPELSRTKAPKETPSAATSITPNPTNAHESATPSSTSPVYGKGFTLTILGQNVPVSVGVDRPTLAQNPGWLETSAYPGEEGVCVVYGHRNRNHLKVLKDIDFGDTITVTLEDCSTISYKVVSIKVLESDSDLRVPLLSGQHIMLTTCYPFYYTGHAPGKFVVILQAID
ncbi:MAG: sortase [Clostridia bacterium]|nr:sortase [Clostridia bacterium]